MPAELWTVILAAGAGRRLSAVTGGVPKQFWRNEFAPSLLRQTLDRFRPLSAPDRTVLIVDAGHLSYLAACDLEGPAPVVVVQPEERGTAAGVLMALTPVLHTRADDVVVITPADHGVRDASRFRRGVRHAARRVVSRNEVILFGVEPATPREDYGWISLPTTGARSAFARVESFIEKPNGVVAGRLFDAGAVWNTMVVVARASAIRSLYSTLLPELTDLFRAAAELPDPARHSFLRAVYASLPRRDFSRDVLSRASGLVAYVWPAEIGWSDLGTPDRLKDWHGGTAAPASVHAITAA